MYQNLQWQDPYNISQIGIYGLKIYHLATMPHFRCCVPFPFYQFQMQFTIRTSTDEMSALVFTGIESFLYGLTLALVVQHHLLLLLVLVLHLELLLATLGLDEKVLEQGGETFFRAQY
jgi:hypothetical protein